MNDACKKVRAQVKGLLDSARPDERTIHAVRMHAACCASCREFCFSTRLAQLLREALAEEIPEPSASFFAGLRLRLAAAEQPGAGALFRDLFTRAGLRLAPAMAAVALLLSGSLAYVSSSTMDGGTSYTIEDMILFEQSQASTDSILFNIFPEER